MNAGSCFFAEIRRTVSSVKPAGTVSSPMSVTNPHLYSRAARDSIVSIWLLMELCISNFNESVLMSQDCAKMGSMADNRQRWPENAPGKYFVDESCIASDFCVAVAPANFRMDESGHAY